MCVHTCRGHPWVSFFRTMSTLGFCCCLVFWGGKLTGLELADWLHWLVGVPLGFWLATLAGQRAPRIFLCLSPQHWEYNISPCLAFLCWFWWSNPSPYACRRALRSEPSPLPEKEILKDKSKQRERQMTRESRSTHLWLPSQGWAENSTWAHSPRPR